MGAGTLLAIEQAAEPALDLATRVALCGGVALFLLATAVIQLAVSGASRQLPRWRLAAAGLALGLIPLGAWPGPLLTIGALAAVLGAAVTAEALANSSLTS